MHPAENLLDEKSPDARARINCGQDEEGLKHDRKVVPEGHARLAQPTEGAGEDLGHADGKSGCTPCAPNHRMFPDRAGQIFHLLFRHRETQLCHPLHHRRRFPAQVDGEIFPGRHRAGGHQGQHPHAHLGDHRPIPHQPDIRLTGQQLGRGSRSHQTVEAADGPTGDGDKTEWKDRPGKNRPGSINEAGQGRHLKLGRQKSHHYTQGRHRANFQEGTQIIPRGQQ